MKSEYLPSKQFVKRLGAIVIILACVLAIYKGIDLIKKPKTGNEIGVKIVKAAYKDSNSNDIPDWEERLWGLNPAKDGELNKEFIISKRRDLNPNASLDKQENLTESDSLSREFFAIIMSLQQTGELDNNAINAISNAFSQKIEAEEIPDSYTENMLKIVEDTPENTIKYFNNLKSLITKYQEKNMGSELGFIIQSIAYNDPQVMYLAQDVGQAYKNLGIDLSKIEVPRLMVELHLSVINNLDKNYQSIKGLSEFFDNPIVATRSIINYRKYNNILVTDLGILLSIFN